NPFYYWVMVIEVAFKGNRKEFFLWEAEEAPPVKTPVIVDADRGEDLGHVHAIGDMAELRAKGTSHGPGTEPVTQRAKRVANDDDVIRLQQVRGQDEDARRKAMERVRANNLVMKLSDAEWRWDRRKLTIYFTAEKRVDFRNLVRELAAMFRTRIELKQIGVRDEAKRLSGVGRCGREYCSASWLPELRPVNLGVAKDQRLSLNPSQISGACGRLMCCLRYEHDFYVQQRKRFPKESRIIVTSKGEEKVVANDIFRERVTLRNSEGETRVLALGDLRRELGTAGGAAVLDTAEEDAPGAAVAGEVIDEELIRLQDTSERPAFRFPWEQAADPSPSERGRTLPIASQNEGDAEEGSAEMDAPESPNAGGEAGAQQRRNRRRRGRRGGRRHPREDRGGSPNGHQTNGDPANGGGNSGGAPTA
ncbi:MAG TPA: regulatory iron-sulfur-containing complex subunit RicT, partial [Gemmatimonadaceae bacterium]|nr:regulatory iron-sulfur-containing complex subunit RicT [Gemmatimonadaceae bacterium]